MRPERFQTSSITVFKIQARLYSWCCNDRLQLGKVRCSKASDWVPTFRSLEIQSAAIKREDGVQTLNPGVPHPGALPLVMSFKAPAAFEYSSGFKKPRGGFPKRSRASFRRATKAVKVGDAAEVPPIRIGSPLRMILKKLE